MTSSPTVSPKYSVASADQLKALVKSHAEGDNEQFYSVAIQVAAKYARAGQTKFATELRDLVDDLRRSARTARESGPVSRNKRLGGELENLLSVTFPNLRFVDLVLSDDLAAMTRQVLVEQRQRDILLRHGLQPTRRLLFVGSPGTGKTSTARAIAGELEFPLYSIRLDSLITRFMGETAAKLRLVFNTLAERRGVYLFDEVDALAGERASPNDVGEMRRVLNSFLQFLEEEQTESIVIAATNHPGLLDIALYRRFDTILRFKLPTPGEVKDLISNRLARFDIARLAWSRILNASAGLSHAEVVLSAESAAKIAVLAGHTSIGTHDLVRMLEDRHRGSLQPGETV